MRIPPKSHKYLVIAKYEETELFADALISLGEEIQKMYLCAELKDKYSIVWDEINRETTVVIVDSAEGSFLAQRSPVNNAIFIFLNLMKGGEDDLVKTLDFYEIQVKHSEDQKRNDWTKAAVLLKERVSKSLNWNPFG